MEKDHYPIKELPPEARPRERLFALGAEALSPAEILAIVIGTGTRKETAVSLAERLLGETGGLASLAGTSPAELKSIRGIGEAKASQISAAVELGRRICSAPSRVGKVTVDSPQVVSDLFMPEMRYLQKEHFKAIILNTKNEIIRALDISIGSLNSSIVHPRELFKEAIRNSGASVIALHNHPSGNITPSKEDIRLTKRLLEAGEILGIELLDHIIIGDGKYLSMKTEGMLH